MTETSTSWEQRVADHWRRIDEYDEPSFRAVLDTLLDALPPDDPIAAFERAAVFDSFGDPAAAVPLYRAALAAGVTGERRRRAVIQMASSIRNLGEPQQAVDLLTAELEAPADHLSGAVRGFLALALADVGREREAVAVALAALSQYLPRYNRSLARYANAIDRADDATD